MSLQNAQDTLQNAILTTFLANLDFLNIHDNSLYQRINGLSQAINSGVFKENYSLEFLQEDGDFDIYDHKNNSYLYNKKPRKYNRLAYNKADFTSKGTFSILDPQNFQKKKNADVFKEVEYFCNFTYAHTLLLNNLAEYVEIFDNTIEDYETKKYKFITKYMFIGTLLGRHIPLILEKTKAKTLFVCEQNLELFRLSLFVVDYSVLARDGNSVIISIMDDLDIFNQKASQFIRNSPQENSCINYFSTDYNIEDYFHSILTLLLGTKTTSFNYHMLLENVWKNVAERVNKYSILQFLLPNEDKLTNTPVLFLAAGPSLSENITWVKKNKDKFIIVTVAAAHQTLNNHGIIPDIITTVDPQYTVKTLHFDNINTQELQDSLVLASINTDGRVLNKLNPNNIFLYEVIASLHSSSMCAFGYSVGEITLANLIGLKFKNIYCLGLDLAINQKTGATHTKGYFTTSYGDDLKSKKHKEESDSFSFDNELVEIPGNLEKMVYTNRGYAMSVNALNENIAAYKQTNQTIYNLSPHGALFQGTIPKNIQEVELDTSLNKSTLKKQLSVFLHSMSKNKLSQPDYEKLQKELTYVKGLEQILSELEKTPSNTLLEFDKKINHLVQLFLFPPLPCPFLTNIFNNFFTTTLQYLYYCLNTQKLKKEKAKMQKAEKVFLNQLKPMLEKYIYYLNQI